MARLLGITTLLLSLSSGCSHKPNIAQASMATSTGSQRSTLPCDVLAIEDAESVIGTPFETSRAGGRPVLVGMKMCSLDHIRGVWPAWGVLERGANARFEAYKAWHEPHLASTKVAGNPALWDARLTTLVVLIPDRAVGDRAVAVRLGVEVDSAGAEQDGRRLSSAELESRARALAERAVQRVSGGG